MIKEIKRLQDAHGAMEMALRNDITLLKQPAPLTVMVSAWPELIDALCAGNERNRKVKQKHVSYLAKLMAGGEWYLTGQGFSVDTNGENIDSGHRSAALVEAGYPALPLNLTLGVDRNAVAYIDTHAKRSACDTLTLLLEQVVQAWVAAVARLMSCIVLNGSIISTTSKPSAPHMAGMLMAVSDALQEFESCYKLDTQKAWPSARIVAWLLFAQMDLPKAMEVAHAVRSGAMLSANSPAMRLRNSILKGSARGGADQSASFFETVAIMRAAFEGRQLSKVYQASCLNSEELRICKQWKQFI